MKNRPRILISILISILCCQGLVFADYDEYGFEWERLFDDAVPDGGNEQAYGLAIDQSSNLVVVGASYDGTNHNLVVLKYTSQGDLIWSSSFLMNCDSPRVAIDNNNNIVVGGVFIPVGPGYHDAFVKVLDPNGQQVWTQTYDYGGRYNNLTGIAVDSENNVVFGGYFNDTGVNYDDDYYVCKLDSNGAIIWQQTYITSGHDMAYGLAIDLSDDSVVQIGQSPYYGLHAVKYSASGSVLWSTGYHTGHYGAAQGVVVDSNSNIYVTGNYHNDGSDSCGNNNILDVRTMKLDSDGNIIWIEDYDSGCVDLGRRIEIDSNGNLLILGIVYGTSSVLIYDPDGNLVFLMQDIDNGRRASYGFALDSPTGSFYTSGTTGGEDKDWLIVKYGYDQPPIWGTMSSAITSASGTNISKGTNMFNTLAFLIVPMGAVIFLRIMRRKK